MTTVYHLLSFHSKDIDGHSIYMYLSKIHIVFMYPRYSNVVGTRIAATRMNISQGDMTFHGKTWVFLCQVVFSDPK